MSGPTPALGSDELAKLAARCAPQLRIDLSRADHRLVLTHFGDLVEGIEAHELVAPLTERTRNRYLNLVENLRRWCVMEGFVEEGAQLHEVPVASLRTLVELWLAWRCSEVTEDHPLVEVGRATRAGMRRGTQGLQDPAELRAALSWWASCYGLSSVVSPRAQAISGARRAQKKARGLSDEEIESVALALYQGEVFDLGFSKLRGDLCHARELAAFNVSLQASLRASERVLLRDEHAHLTSQGELIVVLGRTKRQCQGPVSCARGRTVVLPGDGQQNCPVVAGCSARGFSWSGA